MAKKKNNEITIRSSAAEYLTYIAATGDDPQSFEMRYEDENVWLTQKMLATLYDVSVPAINQHIKKIFDDNELEFATVQNKLHWAIHGQTASEVIYARADAEKEHMGLTYWKDEPHGKFRNLTYRSGLGNTIEPLYTSN